MKVVDFFPFFKKPFQVRWFEPEIFTQGSLVVKYDHRGTFAIGFFLPANIKCMEPRISTSITVKSKNMRSKSAEESELSGGSAIPKCTWSKQCMKFSKFYLRSEWRINEATVVTCRVCKALHYGIHRA